MIRLINLRSSERGSLALEQVLFIGAIAVVAGGILLFYQNLDNYFRGVSPGNAATPNGQIQATTQGG